MWILVLVWEWVWLWVWVWEVVSAVVVCAYVYCYLCECVCVCVYVCLGEGVEVWRCGRVVGLFEFVHVWMDIGEISRCRYLFMRIDLGLHKT
jgi:hypothetical protein